MRMKTEAFEPGWIRRDANRAALSVARERLARAEREHRNLNDAMADAYSEVKEARKEVARLTRECSVRGGKDAM